MRILVTGVRGFVGTVLEQQAVDAGWAVDGVDLDLYQETSADVVPVAAGDGSTALSDFRELRVEDLAGFDAVVHLAAISSDAACDLRADQSDRLNGSAAIDLARLTKKAGVSRFVFASSCSVYGSAPNRVSDETSQCTPISTYARSKLSAEAGIQAEASSTFAPTILRFATLYGLSPNLRSDLVVNTMVASAQMTGEINLHGSGEQSRPLLHVRDAASTILDVLKSGEDDMRGQVFNVTDESTGYSIAQIAEMVRRRVPGSRVVHHPAATDRRHYRVDGTRLHRFCRRPSIRLEDGVAEVADGLRSPHWQQRASALESNRARGLRHLLERGEFGDDLRRRR
ncbi:NAD-dependent dehydratase [Mycolicibacterium madagascariense]|uniref:NAD-dependent dehydratase n=1 Tax=Mycolicibacterium madagascariense TaxID=212765 RepID=A0A7I7XCU4_9MYCO|nr:NAD(P)-dependent oxidoreductase [Mycolicibacterium madagascariense]MCV7015675.1 NAD(P)-dependent oxidoreductase [Mycolicibacterium madagascariense]BBZ27090.1 NAD-dependent dehydratase [Mycolicibacterium madagascariense]